jgi:hypothetical protein
VSIGKDAADATARRLRKEAELNAKNNGVAVATESKNARRVLSAAISDYLEDTKLSRKRKTYAAYDLTLRYFAQCCSKMYVDEIERKDLLKFSEFLRDVKDQAPRSVYNKFENLMTFLKSTGYSRTCGQERLATIRGGRTRDIRKRGLGCPVQSLQTRREALV